MAFNIPKAWSPGLAIPQYIKDEGLQRHAFTTLEAPDGTYDNPAVGNGGFVVPKYITDEGYGQGAFITKMAPRGSYFGPKIPNWLNKPGGNTIQSTTPVAGGTQFTLKSMGSLGGLLIPATASSNPASVAPARLASSSSAKTALVLGGLGILGVLAYRHFKKKG